MPIQYKIRRGSTSEANSLTLTEGEIYMDLDQNELRVYNGTTLGGYRILNIDGVNGLISGLATVATSGSYNDLLNKPFVPNLTSQLMNDAGFVGVSGGSVTGLLTTQKTDEVINTKTNATGVVTHDFTSGSIWYHSNISANFTPNFTNVPTTNNRSIVNTLVLSQGVTPYIPIALQIDGIAQTIKWLGSTVPTAETQTVNVVSFVMIRTNNTWTVLGSLSLYG